jgi:hypothetical protein
MLESLLMLILGRILLEQRYVVSDRYFRHPGSGSLLRRVSDTQAFPATALCVIPWLSVPWTEPQAFQIYAPRNQKFVFKPHNMKIYL